MKPKSPSARTLTILKKFRKVVEDTGLRAWEVLNELNNNHLHKDNQITIHTVNRWLGSSPSPSVMGESLLALEEWIKSKQ